MVKREERVFPLQIEVRKGEKRKIVGYASVFNTWSEDLGGFREMVKPGAFTKTIKESDVRALFNHDSNYVLGRNQAGTLLLEEDAKGLKIEIDPPDTQWARDLGVSIDRGDISQMSFSFSTVKDEWNTKDGQNDRSLVEVRLFDVSPVTYPAYPQTVVGVRSFDVEEMRRILLRAELNLGMTENDKRRLGEYIDVLQTLRGEPGPTSHSPEAMAEPEPTFHSVGLRWQQWALRRVEHY